VAGLVDRHNDTEGRAHASKVTPPYLSRIERRFPNLVEEFRHVWRRVAEVRSCEAIAKQVSLVAERPCRTAQRYASGDFRGCPGTYWGSKRGSRVMRWLILVGLLSCGCRPAEPVAPTGEPTGARLRPVVAGNFWQVAASPDLGPYDNRPAQQPVDFAVWQAKDGTWQLWSCIRGT